jgi:hypothetical protein
LTTRWVASTPDRRASTPDRRPDLTTLAPVQTLLFINRSSNSLRPFSGKRPLNVDGLPNFRTRWPDLRCESITAWPKRTVFKEKEKGCSAKLTQNKHEMGKPRTRKLVNPRTLKTKEKAPAESKRFSLVNALENPWERKKKTFFLKNFYLFLFKIEKF